MYSPNFRKLEENIKKWLFKGYILIIYGARQLGKTTLVKQILREIPRNDYTYLNCDDYDTKNNLEEADNFTSLINFVGRPKILVIDEAQRVKNIGLKLKLLYDNLSDTQILVTGSSSFDLVNEPLTGRSLSFKLYPFSISEVTSNKIEIERNIDKFLLYGSYPKIYLTPEHLVEKVLKEMTEQYLYKDLLNFEGIKKSDMLIKLLKLLAYQLGQEFSYNELAAKLSIDKKSVEKYIDILEKSFVIFRLGPFSRNLRNELKKLRKVYFYDLGVRNALINDFNDLEIRPDLGHLWENFCITERMKFNDHNEYNPNYYFWRSYEQKEIDLVEDWGRKKNLQAFELKYSNDGKYRFPKEFLETYPGASTKIITRKLFPTILAERF
jgi:predicted AAA+ superfamily ATPase